MKLTKYYSVKFLSLCILYNADTAAAHHPRRTAACGCKLYYPFTYRLLITGDYRSLSIHFSSNSNLPGYLKSILFSFTFQPSPFGPSIFYLPVLRNSPTNSTFYTGIQMDGMKELPQLLSPISLPTSYDPRKEASIPGPKPKINRDPRILRTEQKKLRAFVLRQYDVCAEKNVKTIRRLEEKKPDSLASLRGSTG